jgi:hypothetical protein
MNRAGSDGNLLAFRKKLPPPPSENKKIHMTYSAELKKVRNFVRIASWQAGIKIWDLPIMTLE